MYCCTSKRTKQKKSRIESMSNSTCNRLRKTIEKKVTNKELEKKGKIIRRLLYYTNISYFLKDSAIKIERNQE